MRCFVAGDDAALVAQVRELLIQLRHDCPESNTSPLANVMVNLMAPAPGTPTGQTIRFEGEAAVIVVMPPDIERSLAVVREIRQVSPARVLAVGPATDPKLLLRALREGAHEYLDQADLKAELSEASDRMQAADKAQAPAGKIFAVVSPSGGGGSSTLAANLAAVLAMQHRSCALFDLKLEAGDLAPLLDLKPIYSIADVCQNLRRLDTSLFQGCLVAHRSGIQLLAAPTRLADVVHVTPEGVAQALSMAARNFPCVVVDVAPSYRLEQTSVLLQADVILLVLRLEFTSLRNTRTMLEYLEEIGVPSDRLRIVVNRYGQPSELDASQATEALGVKVSHFLPEDAKTVNRANNQGVLVVLQSPTAKISRAIVALGLSLTEQRRPS